MRLSIESRGVSKCEERLYSVLLVPLASFRGPVLPDFRAQRVSVFKPDVFWFPSLLSFAIYIPGPVNVLILAVRVFTWCRAGRGLGITHVGACIRSFVSALRCLQRFSDKSFSSRHFFAVGLLSLLQLDATSLDCRCWYGHFLPTSLICQVDDLFQHDLPGLRAQLVDIRGGFPGRLDRLENYKASKYQSSPP